MNSLKVLSAHSVICNKVPNAFSGIPEECKDILREQIQQRAYLVSDIDNISRDNSLAQLTDPEFFDSISVIGFNEFDVIPSDIFDKIKHKKYTINDKERFCKELLILLNSNSVLSAIIFNARYQIHNIQYYRNLYDIIDSIQFFNIHKIDVYINTDAYYKDPKIKLRILKDSIEAGLYVNKIIYLPNKKYTTLLHNAIRADCKEIVEALINFGANPYIRDSAKFNCFELAQKFNKPEILKMFK